MAAKPIKDIDNLVLGGKWNIFIFTPEWMKDNFFGETKLNIDFIVPNGAITFKSEDIAIIVSSESIRLRALRYNGTVFKKLITILRTIVRLLAQTPVSGFGVNFKYDLGDEVADFFKNLQFSGKSINKEERRWAIDDSSSKMILNLMLTKIKSQTTIDFNYHYPIENCAELASIIEDDAFVCMKQNESISELREFFNIQAEQL